jgi:glycosyltransferase involved in cell wall biosynthesis
MPGETASAASRKAPDLSLVMPCFNEEAVVGSTARELLDSFARAGHELELVAVDNGSRDRTGEILRELAAADPRLVPVHVELNQGYGFGILSGFPRCTAPWVGLLCADGQVEAQDVVKLFERALELRAPALVKVRRRFRKDGLKRKLVSVLYNLGANLLFGGLGSIDVNGNPKLFPRELLPVLDLSSKDWFLDAEIMIKCRKLGLRALEVNVFGQLRRGGASNVRAVTCLEFAKNLLACRFGNDPRATPRGAVPARAPAGDPARAGMP